MRYQRFIIGLFMILGLFVFKTNTTFAVIKINNSDINTEIIPDTPQPYSDATVKITSYATDLNRSSIEWKVDRQVVLSGVGRTSYSFKTLGPNTATTIDIKIITPENITLNKQIVIRPSEIEMLWQATDSYTPPFYKGKALPIQEGSIKVVAFPNTINVSKANKKNMVYTWSLNNKSASGDSGYGKDSFVFQNNILLNKEKIKLSVSSIDNSYTATGAIDIETTNPRLIFYKKSPINGVLHNMAITNSATMFEDEMTILAEPYFLNRNSSDLQYNWKINNDSIPTPSKRTELTIRPSSRGGYARIDLSVESATKLFQSIKNNIKINL